MVSMTGWTLLVCFSWMIMDCNEYQGTTFATKYECMEKANETNSYYPEMMRADIDIKCVPHRYDKSWSSK